MRSSDEICKLISDHLMSERGFVGIIKVDLGLFYFPPSLTSGPRLPSVQRTVDLLMDVPRLCLRVNVFQ